MNFPHTHLTLIERLAAGGSEDDWNGFLKDYWGPVCRFSLRLGARDLDEAEEIASQTFETLWKNRLLDRWVSNPAAKLRSLLCSVVRRILANRNRAEARRGRLQGELVRLSQVEKQDAPEDTDVFYASWIEQLTQQAMESLAIEYSRRNQTDRIRVLYGRVCEGLSIAEVAAALSLSASTVDFYYRDARDRLAQTLQDLLRPQVARYCRPDQVQDEFALEWEGMGRYLEGHGGLEEAIRQAYSQLPCRRPTRRGRGRIGDTVRRLISEEPPSASRCEPMG